MDKEQALELAGKIVERDQAFHIAGFRYTRERGYSVLVQRFGKGDPVEITSPEDWNDRVRELEIWEEWQKRKGVQAYGVGSTGP